MISVCMATFNGEYFIKEQIDSIINQISDCDELIISDDASTDNTINIIKSFSDNRIKLIKGPCRGYIQNFNNAIKHASGEFIFLSDQDDIWMPNKVQIVMTYFLNNHLVVHNALLIDEKGNSKNIFLHNNQRDFRLLVNLIKHQTFGCCIAFDRQICDKILPIPRNKNVLHETWISLIASWFDFEKIKYIEEPLIKYRRHSNNVSTFTRSNFVLKVWERIVILFFLVLRIIKLKLLKQK